jgi:hypothetical protein
VLANILSGFCFVPCELQFIHIANVMPLALFWQSKYFFHHADVMVFS